MSYVTLHVNVIPLTVEDRLLIKALQTVKNDLSFQQDSGNGIYCFISYE